MYLGEYIVSSILDAIHCKSQSHLHHIVLFHAGGTSTGEKKHHHSIKVPSNFKIHLNICNIEIWKNTDILESGPFLPSLFLSLCPVTLHCFGFLFTWCCTLISLARSLNLVKRLEETTSLSWPFPLEMFTLVPTPSESLTLQLNAAAAIHSTGCYSGTRHAAL